MDYNDTSFAISTRTGFIINQYNTHYSVSDLSYETKRYFSFSFVSASVIPAASDRPTNGHRNYNHTIEIIFDTDKDKLPSCSMDKMLWYILATDIELITLCCIIPFNCYC